MVEFINILFFTTILIYLIGAGGTIVLRKRKAIANYWAYYSAMLASIFGVTLSLYAFSFGGSSIVFQWTLIHHIEFMFSIDLLSTFFLFILFSIGLIVSLYAPKYTQKYINIKNLSLLGLGYNLFLLSMVGVIVAGNAFTFLIMWETMSLLSFLLVLYEHEQAEVRRSSLLYVIMTHIGTGFIIVLFLLLFTQTGTLDFIQISLLSNQLSISMNHLLFVLALIGFGTKAGIVPLHIWLPRAHPIAPSHISALMSAVMIKTALYGFIRIVYDLIFVQSLWWGVVVSLLGIITAIYGILFGVVQQDMKRFLAYSSVENVGIIFMSLGISFIFSYLEQPLLSHFALIAAFYHILNHAFFKSLLFMGAGAVYKATGTRNIEQLGGLLRFMPYTAAFFLIGSLAIASLPPLNGFISKWMVFQSLLYLPFENNGNNWLSLLGTAGAVALLFIGALVALGIVKIFGITFLGQPRTKRVEKAEDIPSTMKIAFSLASVSIILLGIFPGFVINQLQRISHTLLPKEKLQFKQLLQVETVGHSAAAIQPLHLIIVLLILLMITFLSMFLTLGKSTYKVEEPWACGIHLRPEMSYSGTSLSHPLLLIFKPIFGESFASRMISQRVIFTIKIRKAFTNLLYEPIFRMTLFISYQIRRIQDGNIHSYLTYIFLTLLIMLVFVTR